MRHFTTKVMGLKRHGSAKLEADTSLALRREPRNAMDRNAIAVYANRRKVGYLQRGLAAELAPLVDTGARRLLAQAHKDSYINLYLLEAGEKIGVRQNIRKVTSSRGNKHYFVDRAEKLCTCPAGLLATYSNGKSMCRHIKDVLAESNKSGRRYSIKG